MTERTNPDFTKLNETSENLIRQELTTYHMKDGVVHRTVVERRFYGDGSYQDAYHHTPLN